MPAAPQAGDRPHAPPRPRPPSRRGPRPRAGTPAYLDDRSDPAAILRSSYNAVARHEYARAWSYYGEPKPAAGYPAFVAGYAATAAVELALGPVASEGAAGSTYATVPVALAATAPDGSVAVFAGCYTTRQLQPAIQDPPFRPLEIVRPPRPRRRPARRRRPSRMRR